MKDSRNMQKRPLGLLCPEIAGNSQLETGSEQQLQAPTVTPASCLAGGSAGPANKSSLVAERRGQLCLVPEEGLESTRTSGGTSGPILWEVELMTNLLKRALTTAQLLLCSAGSYLAFQKLTGMMCKTHGQQKGRGWSESL